MLISLKNAGGGHFEICRNDILLCRFFAFVAAVNVSHSFRELHFVHWGNLLEPSRLCLFACQVYKCTYNIYVVSSPPYWSSTDLSRTQGAFLFFVLSYECAVVVHYCCNCLRICCQLSCFPKQPLAVLATKSGMG